MEVLLSSCLPRLSRNSKATTYTTKMKNTIDHPRTVAPPMRPRIIASRSLKSSALINLMMRVSLTRRSIRNSEVVPMALTLLASSGKNIATANWMKSMRTMMASKQFETAEPPQKCELKPFRKSFALISAMKTVVKMASKTMKTSGLSPAKSMLKPITIACMQITTPMKESVTVSIWSLLKQCHRPSCLLAASVFSHVSLTNSSRCNMRSDF
mmetsp:Transcript_37997/g.104484  ORF Transcript_37997/g.104484 Transcript_37997/m.104484 type:complete len:212 (+) Transcript_37997:875-1510(+)